LFRSTVKLYVYFYGYKFGTFVDPLWTLILNLVVLWLGFMTHIYISIDTKHVTLLPLVVVDVGVGGNVITIKIVGFNHHYEVS